MLAGLTLKRLVVKLGPVNGLASSPVTSGKIATLTHKAGYDAMEHAAFVMQRLAGFAHALFAGAKGAEVLGRLGASIGEEFHFDATGGFIADGDFKEDLRVRCHHGVMGLVRHVCRLG